MDSLYIILIVVAVILIGGSALPYLKSKGIISKNIANEIAEDVDKFVDIASALVTTLKEKNIDFKAVNTVLDIANIVTDYVDDVIDIEDQDEKAEMSLNVVDQVLKEIGITPTESQRNLIDIVVKQGVSFLTEKKKMAK